MQYNCSFPYNGRERSVLPAFSKNETLTLYCHILYVYEQARPKHVGIVPLFVFWAAEDPLSTSGHD